MPEVMIMEGQDISEEEALSPGWQSALGGNKKTGAGISTRTDDATSVGSQGRRRTMAPSSAIKRLAAASRLPPLPRQHTRVIVRPDNGLDVKKVSELKFAQAIAMAAALAPSDIAEDIFCPNVVQNIFIIATPCEKNANAYAKFQQIRLNNGAHKISAYLAVPEGTCKVVIRGLDADVTDQELNAIINGTRQP